MMADFEIISGDRWAAPPRGKLAPFHGKPRELWLHHTATQVTNDAWADARRVQAAAFSRGFYDTSYTWLIHPDGTIFEGRDRRFIGAHTLERNTFAWAISFIGNYSVLEPSLRQMDAARWLIDQHAHEFSVPRHLLPTAAHRDNPASPSECCGNKLYPRRFELRQPYAPPIVHPFPEEPQVPVPVKPDVEQRIDVRETPQGWECYVEYLDVEGNGWVSVPVARDRIVSVLGRGSYPPAEGYWSLNVFGANERGDETVITIKGKPYQRGVLFWVIER